MNSFVVLASLFATTLLAQTPPNFTPNSSNKINLAFGNTTITPGLQIGINVPASAPTVAASTSLAGTYLLALIDPDAPSPQNPTNAQLLHWLQPGVQFTSQAPFNGRFASEPIVSYARPSPPVTSSAHRYIALLFLQPTNFTVPDAFKQYNATNRTRFNITTFAQQARLGQVIEANYFLVSNTTAVNGTATTSATGTGAAIASATGVPFKGAGTIHRVSRCGMAVVVLAGVILVL